MKVDFLVFLMKKKLKMNWQIYLFPKIKLKIKFPQKIILPLNKNKRSSPTPLYHF